MLCIFSYSLFFTSLYLRANLIRMKKIIETSLFLCFSAATFFLFYITDSFELLVEWSRQHEEYEIDEWILLIPVIAITLSFVVIKNMMALKKINLNLTDQSDKREKAEKKVSELNKRLTLKVQSKTERLKDINRSQIVLIKCIQLVMHAKDENDLLHGLCKTLVKVGGYKMAWIGYALDDEEKTVKKMAQFGFSDHYVENANIVWADNERGQGPVGKSIRTKKIAVCRDLKSNPDFLAWKEAAIARGYASLIALPLIASNHCFGSLAIYSTRTDVFDDQEINLLLELSENLAFGVKNLTTQTQLIQSEEKFRSLFENSNDGIILHDLKGRIIDTNEKIENILGYEPNELMGKFIQALHPESEKEISIQAFEKTMEIGFSTFETQFKSKGGTPVYVSINSKIYDENAKLVQGIIRDISESKKLQEQLNQAQKMESIGKLAGGIAHEFNNILSIIIGNNELVMEDLPKESVTRESAEEIQIAGMRARDVVKQLLTFSRQDNAAKRILDLKSVVYDSMKMIRSSIPTNIKIQQNLSDDTYPVFGNDTQINQLIINLSSNAVDAMSTKDGLLTVELLNETVEVNQKNYLTKLKPGRYVKFMFSDNGSGMDKETLDRIFEPYYTTKDIGKGSGIGLAVAHGIVQRHGGSIMGESYPGSGTKFTMFFPAYDGTLKQEIDKKILLPTGKECILYVDDEPSIAKLGKRHLESLGYRVESTTDPLEALEMVKIGIDRFDLVISDMAMPKMTGDQLIKEILRLCPKMPTIICTGYSAKFSQKDAKEIGINSFAMKPLNKTQLAKIVRKTLDDTKRPT